MTLFNLLVSLFVIFLFVKPLYSSVTFVVNPGCNLTECENPDQPILFYANHLVNDDMIHFFYSSFDELTISIMQTRNGHKPRINYTALFNKIYHKSITFENTVPTNSFTLIIRRLIKFNDSNDTGLLNENDSSIESYWLKQLKTNITHQDDNVTQPSFQLPLDNINGLLTLNINYPGESMRDSKFPKLRSTEKSYFLDIALNANNYTLPRTRFALEFYIIQYGSEGMQLSSSKYIDDQYTPGIFNVWQIKSSSPIYASSMLWKPVVYQSMERSIEKTTLMEVYDLKNNIELQPSIDQGIFYSFYNELYVSGFNVSFGRAKDGFFTKTNFTFIQMTAGLDILETDSTTKFVTLALVFTLALPTLIALISIVYIIKRRCSLDDNSGYDIIQD